jgi:hypothetical protein
LTQALIERIHCPISVRINNATIASARTLADQMASIQSSRL